MVQPIRNGGLPPIADEPMQDAGDAAMAAFAARRAQRLQVIAWQLQIDAACLRPPGEPMEIN